MSYRMFEAKDKAAILVEALPYIQEFYGKTIVIKYGGNAMVNDELKEKVMQDVALMKYVGIRPVIVHGGGPEITEFCRKSARNRPSWPGCASPMPKLSRLPRWSSTAR